MSYDSDGTTKVLYEPKTDYEIDRIEVMVDKSNHFIDKAQMYGLTSLVNKNGVHALVSIKVL
jgi:hypothetical protein